MSAAQTPSARGQWLFVALPLAAVATLALAVASGAGGAVLLLAAAGLVAAIVSAVHHAEVVALKVGEPLGTLVLALAVTIIEVALIVSVMLGAKGEEAATLTRDTIYATILIITAGVVGLCLLLGGLRHHTQVFHNEAARPALAILVALSVLTLVMPTFTTSAPGGRYSPLQLVFAAVVSLLLWGVFIFGQLVRHRDYFLDETPGDGGAVEPVPPPSGAQAAASLALLLVALIGVVGLAKTLSPALESAVAAAGLPRGVIGIVIAILVLAPETVAAVRAALANRLQTSLNLALGSALASIGLTIPAVVVVSLLLGLPMDLGLTGKDLVLLLLSLFVSVITLGSRRTDFMLGAVHLVVFAAFLFMSLVP